MKMEIDETLFIRIMRDDFASEDDPSALTPIGLKTLYKYLNKLPFAFSPDYIEKTYLEFENEDGAIKFFSVSPWKTMEEIRSKTTVIDIPNTDRIIVEWI